MSHYHDFNTFFNSNCDAKIALIMSHSAIVIFFFFFFIILRGPEVESVSLSKFQ